MGNLPEFISDMYKRLGSILRRIRVSEGKSVRQVCKALQIDPANLSRFERGLNPIAGKSFNKLLDYFKVDIKITISYHNLMHEYRFKPKFTCPRCLHRFYK